MHWTDLLTGAGSGATAVALAVAALRKMLTRAAKDLLADLLVGVAKETDVKAIASDVNDLKVKFASETGGNSHGLRQVVNELDAKVDGVVVDVATLKAKVAA